MASKPNALGAKVYGRDKSGGVRTYLLPDGEEISKREYQARARALQYFPRGRRVTNEKFKKLNRIVTTQVDKSQASMTKAEKREIAWKAAALGYERTIEGTPRHNKMHRYLRELELPEDEYIFVWGEHESS